MLTTQQGQALVRLARQHIERHLGMADSPDAPMAAVLDDPVMAGKRGVFVTLHKNKQLRGCIGSLCCAQCCARPTGSQRCGSSGW